jgi:radical SAM-linked protein
LVPDTGVQSTVKRVIISDLDGAPFPDRPVIPFARPVHDRLRLEISRGCTRGCRFCQAGMIYRPVRERGPATVLDMARDGLASTGYEDLSLLSLSTGDYHCLGTLMETLMQRCQSQRVAVSLPSLRAGVLTPRLMELIRSVRKTGFTIAPEAGSQRLRDVINKNITFEDVAKTVQDAFGMGWRLIKLYFMIGLPTETGADLDAIVDMVRQLNTIRGPNGRKGHINVSVTTFIPKAHTPFQWASQISLDESQEKIAYLKSAFDKMRAVRFKWQSPGMSLLEGILARGDRRMGTVLLNAWKSGCLFDGWSDQFNLSRWTESLTRSEVPIDFFSLRKRRPGEPLPWDHMDSLVDKQFLKDQWASALCGELVEDCRHGQCHACGVCDFEKLQPQVYTSCLSQTLADVPAGEGDQDFSTFLMSYEKLGSARFFGHLELARHFGRAVRRAGIAVKFSAGYHPMPKISFDNPLPLGVESESEFMRMTVASHHSARELIERINPFLPAGVKIVYCKLNPPKKQSSNKRKIDRYRVALFDTNVDSVRIDKFQDSAQWDYTRIRHKGRAQHFDLKSVVTQLDIIDKNTVEIGIRADTKSIARPADILRSVFELAEPSIQGARIRKLK